MVSIPAQAGTVSFDSYWDGTEQGFRSAFDVAQNAAGVNGTIHFGAGTYQTDKSVTITKQGLKLDGAGKNSTVLWLSEGAFGSSEIVDVFVVIDASGVVISDMTLSGPFAPEEKKPLYERPPWLKKGLSKLIKVNSGRTGLSFTNLKLRNADKLIRSVDGVHFDGGRLTDCTFERFIDAVLFRDDNGFAMPTMGAKFIVNNCDWITSSHIADHADSFGMDFGNYTGDFSLIDLRGSEIKNSTFDQAVRWNVHINRCSNFRIWNNVFYGGGAEGNPDWFHALHFEDNCSNFQVGHVSNSSRGNEIYQLATQGTDPSWIISINGEGDNPNESTIVRSSEDVTVANNFFSGEVWRGLRMGSGAVNMRLENNEFVSNTETSFYRHLLFVAVWNNNPNSVDSSPANSLNGTLMTASDELDAFKILQP